VTSHARDALSSSKMELRGDAQRSTDAATIPNYSDQLIHTHFQKACLIVGCKVDIPDDSGNIREERDECESVI
jgi:hypothetical protein